MGAGAVSLLAGLTVLDEESDDPEERRRQMEARESAQNIGALIGLAAGAVGALRQSTEETQETIKETGAPDRDAPVMNMKM